VLDIMVDVNISRTITLRLNMWIVLPKHTH